MNSILNSILNSISNEFELLRTVCNYKLPQTISRFQAIRGEKIYLIVIWSYFCHRITVSLGRTGWPDANYKDEWLRTAKHQTISEYSPSGEPTLSLYEVSISNCFGCMKPLRLASDYSSRLAKEITIRSNWLLSSTWLIQKALQAVLKFKNYVKRSVRSECSRNEKAEVRSGELAHC